MVTIVSLPSDGNLVPGALQGSSSQDGSPSRGVWGRHHHRHHPHGSWRHGSSPTRLGRRHHHPYGHHHGHHHGHHRGPYGFAQKYGKGGFDHSGLMHHGCFYRGPRGRHFFRGVHEIGAHGHGSPFCRRRHRSLSPHHLFHHGHGESSFESTHRGHRERDGRVAVESPSLHFGEPHDLHHSQERNPGSQARDSPQQPAPIEHGIEQFRQLSLASSSTGS